MNSLLRFNVRLFTAAIVSSVLAAGAAAQQSQSTVTEKKVDDLLRQMTLDEKIGQMTQVDMNGMKNKSDIQKYFIGSMLSGGGSDPADISAAGWAKAYDEYQSWALKTRLAIPLIYGIDAVHGHNNIDGAVIFPHNIGLGATRNAELVEKAARATAEEVAGTGMNWAFAPCIAVARDPRWGRTYESFGESAELAEKLGPAAVRGLQGKNLAEPTSVVACAKHFLGDGGTTGGKDQGNTQCDEATLRAIHLPGYAAAIKANVGTIMVSYNSWNGQKMHGNKHLLTDVLKGDLGFQGFLISDWAAIDQLSSNYKNDIEMAINAGLDMIMIPNGPGQKNNYVEFIDLTKQLVTEGKIPQERIDDAVRRILRVKIASRVFEHPYTDSSLTANVGSTAHRAVARECVRQSLVLLKNEKNTLPLSKKIKNLAVVGKAADDLGIQCGGWTIDWQGKPGPVIRGGTTILSALKQAVGPDSQVTFSADGSKLMAAGGEKPDAVIAVIGEMPYAEGKGDRKELNLSAQDLALVEKAKQPGAPVIVILLSGRPLILGSVLDSSDAFIAVWLPGTEGTGVADVLFGDYKPTGKLPHTWPRSMDQVPLHADDAAAKDALFPYGFGLSY